MKKIISSSIVILAVIFAGPFTVHADDRLDAQLVTAAGSGDLEKCKALIDAGADINSGRDGLPMNSPLSAASHQGRVEVVKLLLTRGAEVNLQDNEGKTPLMRAMAGAYGSPLHMDVIKALLDAGADINLKAVDGDSALTAAFKHYGHNPELVKLVQDYAKKKQDPGPSPAPGRQ